MTSVTGFAKFLNMKLLEDEASFAIPIEQQETPIYTTDSLLATANKLGTTFQICHLRIRQLDLEIAYLSQQQMSPDLIMRIQQIGLQRSDYQEVIVQNGQPGGQLRRLQKFVQDLWKSFNPDTYKPTKFCATPVVKWADGISATKGPYTWPAQDIQIISMPSRYAEREILGWTALAHEISHDMLEGSGGLIHALRLQLQWKLPGGTLREQILKNYFLSRISEGAADIMGVLLLGPASGIGCIAYLRSQRKGFLSCTDMSPQGAHPVDISRAYLVAYAMNVLLPNRDLQEAGPGMPIQNWNQYCGAMMDQMVKDLSQTGGYIVVRLEHNLVLQYQCEEVAAYCRQTVDIVIKCLRGIVQIDKWKWNEKDEAMVGQLIGKASVTPRDSRHIVAAAFFESLKRKLYQNPTEKLFYTPQLHIDYQADNNKEKVRIEGVFKSAMERIA